MSSIVTVKPNQSAPTSAAVTSTGISTIVHDHGKSTVTIQERYDGVTGKAKPFRAIAAPKVRGPNSFGQAYVKAAANAVKNANDPQTKKAALENLARIADTQSSEVREAMCFAFAKPKYSLVEYQQQLARNVGPAKASEFMREMRALAETLKRNGTPRIALVSATFAGGGVAEMFRTQAHILQQMGITVEWQKTWTYDARYGEICRKAFDAFQGGKTVISDDDHAHWHEHNLLLARLYQGLAHDPEVGAIFLEDHHAIDMIGAIKEANPLKRIVWRSHVDMAGLLSNKPAAVSVWQKAILPNIELLGPNDVTLFQPGSVPPAAKALAPAVFVAPPGIDPLAPKNEPISWDNAKTILETIAPDLDPTKLHFAGGGRFVPWKGLLPLTRAYLSIAADYPEVNFVLFGAVGDDDWRKVDYFKKINLALAEAKAIDPAIGKRVTPILNKNEEIKAIYTLAGQSQLPVMLPSLAEGYNLMGAEAACHGATPGAALVGGMVRFAESPAIAKYCVDIDDIVEKIDDPAEMYTIADGKLVASPLAVELEQRYATLLRAVFESRLNDPQHGAAYAEAAKAALQMTTDASLLSMSRDYMAAMVATGADLHKAAAAPSTLNAPTLGVLADVLMSSGRGVNPT